MAFNTTTLWHFDAGEQGPSTPSDSIEIELNPVRAGMVKHPRDHPGSSYRANAQGRADGIVAPHPVYDALGPDAAARQAAYRQLFRRRIGETTLDEIRAATNKGWVLGTERFRKAVEEVLDRPTAPRPKGGDRRSKAYRESIRRFGSR